MDIRLILTTRCQLQCWYCHREGQITEKKIVDACADDIIATCDQLVKKYGKNITISGGEPLLHNKFEEIIEELYNMGSKLTLITNGHLVYRHVKMMNLFKSIHISVPTIDYEQYFEITGGKFENLKSSINQLKAAFPNISLKINCVVSEEIISTPGFLCEMIIFSTHYKATLKLIKKFDPILMQSDPNLSLIGQLSSLGYILLHQNERVQVFKHSLYCFVEITEITCAVAQKYCDPCAECKVWGDIFVGVDNRIFFCPWDGQDTHQAH